MAKKEVSSEQVAAEANPRIEKLTQRAKQVNEILGGKEIKSVREAGALMDALSMEIERAFGELRLETKLSDLKLNLSGENEMKLRKIMGPVGDLSITEALVVLDGLSNTIQMASEKHLEDVAYSELKIGWKDEQEQT